MLVNGRDDCDPDPSPDGTRLAFASRLGGGPSSIWVADADGTHPRRVTRGGTDFKLAWSPDGSRIAFERQHGPNDYELLVVNADGTGLRSIRGGPGFDGTPDWSPTDGDLLIGSSGRKGLGSAAIRCKGSALYRLDPEGSNVRRLTRCGREVDSKPQWSPDGSALAWARGTPYGGPLRARSKRVDADTTGLIRILDPHGEGAGWSPDGQWIVYVPGTGRLSTRSVRDGAGRIRLTSSSDERQSPLAPLT